MSATSRYLLDEAPGGLFLVQDLLNTRGVPAYDVRDLLDTVTDARRWARTAVERWRETSDATGGVGALGGHDLVVLRTLRRDLVRLVEEGRPRPTSVTCGVSVTDAGDVLLTPVGSGARWLASAVWTEVALAQRDGRWTRLKTCRNPHCPCAFVDVTRNNSRVWHDVHTCGNVANLRASRARRRAATH